MDCKYQCAVHALFALEQAVLITGTTTLGAGVIRSCAVGCMPILLLGRHQHMGRRWCVGGGQSAQLCPDDDCICCIGMHRHTYQPGEKSLVSSVGEPLLPPITPFPSLLSCQGAVLCCQTLQSIGKENTELFRFDQSTVSMCHLLCFPMRVFALVSAAVCMMLMLLNCK